MSDAKNILETFRDVVQDLPVPELRAVKVSVEAMRGDMKYMREDMDRMRSDFKLSNDAMREEMRLRSELLERTIAHGDQRNEQLLLAFIAKFDTAIDFRERLATHEARLPRQ